MEVMDEVRGEATGPTRHDRVRRRLNGRREGKKRRDLIARSMMIRRANFLGNFLGFPLGEERELFRGLENFCTTKCRITFNLKWT